MRYLITGHTGFKGTWLSSLLLNQEHEVFGFSDTVRSTSLFAKLNLREKLAGELYADICDASQVSKFLREVKPDRVIHLAAQPIVSEGYKFPSRTYQVNLGGTLNVLEATLNNSDARLLVVTTDKVYTPAEKGLRFSESSQLGSDDPYGNSKALADLATQVQAKIYKDRVIRVARAGNVIGLGDDSPHRLIPDIMKALRFGSPLEIRKPEARRPWQHVLDCVGSYLDFLELENGPIELNIGPQEEETMTVLDVVQIAEEVLASKLRVELVGEILGPETLNLTLDTTLSHTLKITNEFPQREAIRMTVLSEWSEASMNPNDLVRETLRAYLERRTHHFGWEA